MRLQSILLGIGDIFPETDKPESAGLLYSASGDIREENGEIVMSAGSCAAFDTCFGGFITEKWLRYTSLSTLWVQLEFTGSASVSLARAYFDENGELSRETVSAGAMVSSGAVRLSVPEVMPGSMYYPVVRANGEARITDAFFGCDDEVTADDGISIALAICTYRREQYVERTLAALDREVFSNRRSPLRGHLKAIVADNGRTLDASGLRSDNVLILPNKNCGGTGGFTRCMLEALDRGEEFTHVLLADDDAVMPVRSLEIIYGILRLLCPEHKDISLGGALWRSDLPWMQYEAGAGWDGCRVTPRGAGVDLRSPSELLLNSRRNEAIDFNGWWLMCIPMERIREVGLPLPLFLHRDDIEYGLRLGGRIVMPDGAGVWHESFERRLSGVSEYYDLRNMVIVNALHRSALSRRGYISFVKKWYRRNLYSHRYRYIELNLEAVRDALKGIDFFMDTDPAALNDRLRKRCYELTDAAELAGELGMDDFGGDYARQLGERFSPEGDGVPPLKRMLFSALTVLAGGGIALPAKELPTLAVHPTPVWKFFRAGDILHTDADGRGFIARRDRAEIKRCRALFRETKRLAARRYNDVCAEYRERYGELTSEDFWKSYLSGENK